MRILPSFGLLALFGRALGGWASDRLAARGNLNQRITLLFVLMLGEGAGLLMFAHAATAPLAIAAMLVFGLFTHMACGATYALVPFIDNKALGGVAGIIGAGGNHREHPRVDPRVELVAVADQADQARRAARRARRGGRCRRKACCRPSQ